MRCVAFHAFMFNSLLKISIIVFIVPAKLVRIKCVASRVAVIEVCPVFIGENDFFIHLLAITTIERNFAVWAVASQMFDALAKFATTAFGVNALHILRAFAAEMSLLTTYKTRGVRGTSVFRWLGTVTQNMANVAAVETDACLLLKQTVDASIAVLRAVL